MDITDEQAKLNKFSSSPNEPLQTSSSSDHVIPQMVITSADDVSDEQKNITECSIVLIPPSNGHSIDVGDKSASAEFPGSANSVTEDKPVVDFEDISVVVRDVVSRCTESVSHSVRQRPLVMEVEKNVQSQEPIRDDGPIKCPPPPPPPVPSNVTPPPSITPPPSSITSISSPAVTSHPTTMQRPLIFEGVTTKTDSSIEIQKESTAFESSKIKDEQICDIANQERQFISDIPSEKAKSPEECTTPTKKEGLQGVKKFFDSLLHHETQDSVTSPEVLSTQKESDVPDVLPDASKSSKSSVKKFFNSPQTDVSVSPPPESPSEVKESASFAKDAKQSIKAFFDTFKHEPESKEISESKIKVDQSTTSKEAESEGYVLSSTPESPKESKQTTKENIKAFFDNFKRDPIDLKLKSSSEKKLTFESDAGRESLNQSPELSEPESPKEIKESSSFKDTKQNIKAFFDTFKHEPSEPKLKSNVKISISQPNIGQEEDSTNLQPSDPKRPRTPTSFAKDTKQNIKAFFDTFKHEPTEQKSKENMIKLSVSQPVISDDKDSEKNIQSSAPESPTEAKDSSSFVKDTKQSIKTFFDTLRHESSEQKQAVCKKSHSQPDFSKESETTLPDTPEISKSKEPSSLAKGAKQNVKSFFESFKSESATPKPEDTQKCIENLPAKESNQELDHDKSIKSDEAVKEPSSSFAKEARQNIKTFFDNLKHDSEDVKSKKSNLSEPDLHKESETPHKHPLKKIFSTKHTELSGDTNSAKCPEDSRLKSSKDSSRVKLFKGPKSVTIDLNPQYSTNGAENTERLCGSVNYINGYDKELVSETKERAQSVPSDRERKKFNIFPEIKKTEDSSISSFDAPDGRSGESRGFKKKFFDSFKHGKSDAGSSLSVEPKKESTKDISAMDLAVGIDESKSAEKSTKEKKGKSIKRSFSDKVSREEMVQNFKGFFDSIGHKSSKKPAKDSEHIYDVVEVKSDAGTSVPVIQISEEVMETGKKSTKAETHGVKKMLSSFRSKDGLKSSSENIQAPIKSAMTEENKHIETELGVMPNLKSGVTNDTIVKDTSTNESEPKSSMFNTIGENILALRDKMLHTKEKRKSELIDDSVKLSDMSSKECEKGLDKDQKITPLTVSEPSNKDNITKMKPVPPEKPVVKEISKVQSPQAQVKVDDKEMPSGPGSLYDTCCMKIAVLLRDKALDIVAEHTKTPPPKPPKPSAEAIAKARAASVSRRIAEAKRMGRSVGENIPYGCDGMRYADDETESSCDYKDVENFDYIMDYELINRYKLDSSKFDTFSVPSTCSGLTSYYTADTITLRDDIYSDAVMETVSLNSDVSYNYKQLPSSSKGDSKSSVPDQKSKSGGKELSTAKSPKKVPPPVPPKPLILQNISKIKGKPDDKAVSQCVNGLSLSPRLKSKFSKDPAATQKRPLLVADIKGTQFSSLQHPKTKKVPPKPARNFDTVLRNESLKNVCSIASTTEKSVPKPSSYEDSTAQQSSIDSSLQSKAKIEKRTKSPPRPPPPNIAKKPEKPPKPERPPPPVKSSNISMPSELNEEIFEKMEINDAEKELTSVENLIDSSSPQSITYENIIEKNQDTNLPDTSVLSDECKLQESSISSPIPDTEPAVTGCVTEDINKLDINIEKDIINNNVEAEKAIADSLNNNVELSEPISSEKPKPPPRNRRIRSRTVEITPPDRSEERLKRSQSLSEIDVEKRVTFLNAEKSLVDSKSLYTVVNKDGKKSNIEKTSRSSPDLVSGRPLPAPPPPPRRFRSLERKSKSNRDSDKQVNIGSNNVDQGLKSPDTSLERIKPPSRRRKTDKDRFFSLHTDQRKVIEESLKRAASVPSKPNRKVKSSKVERYDVNANISTPLTSEESLTLSYQSIPNTNSTESLSKPVLKRDPNSRERSHSSWYDENENIDDSWELVDEVLSQDVAEELKHNPLVPIRRKSKKKSRETSKFYVNMDDEPGASSSDKGISPLPLVSKSPVPLVDKETSPLPLVCSEKSVQTSLETLSHGVVSHDDSEDTDELLDLAQTLQKELSTIINRHKTVNESSEETPSPPLSAAASEKNLADLKELKKISSVRSSTSEVWPVTSSDESDVERVGEDSSNINEVQIKRKPKKIFYIAREIMTSEEAFVDALKLLNVDFKSAVEAANKQKNMSIIPDDVLSQILNHLPQLQHLNENLLMELKDRIRSWDKTEKIADIIVKMGPFLKLYSWYIHDFESNVSLLEDSKRKYPAFAQVVKEFEMSTRCKRLALNHYMLKPIQRIPQYRLLLQEYLHHLTEDSKDYQDTVAALQIVSEVANHANDSMKHGDNAQKLISIQNSIMGHKEIVKPGRVFVKEGELMKLSRKGMQPRWFVLFNDLLLYLTSVQQGLYRVNHELPLTGVTRSFTLAARSPEERQEWIIALTKAIEENASKRSTFTNSRLLQNAQDKTSSEEEGAFVLGKKAPVWIPDARVTMCQLCTSEFTVTFRRHHCRACGKVVCSICSSHRISLPYLGNRIARVCDECHVHLGQGSSACTESGETDSENQQIAVKPHLRTDNRHVKKNKRVLPSVLKEVCANDQGSTISGYLHKKTGKSWKRDWFVVKDKVLYEYKASEDVAALRSTPLLGYIIESFTDAYEGVDASLLFQLTHPGQAPIIFYADTVGSAERWVSALNTATVLE